MMIAREDHLKIIKKLLYKSVNVNVDDDFFIKCNNLKALLTATFKDHAKIIKILLAAKTKVNILNFYKIAL